MISLISAKADEFISFHLSKILNKFIGLKQYFFLASKMACLTENLSKSLILTFSLAFSFSMSQESEADIE